MVGFGVFGGGGGGGGVGFFFFLLPVQGFTALSLKSGNPSTSGFRV